MVRGAERVGEREYGVLPLAHPLGGARFLWAVAGG